MRPPTSVFLDFNLPNATTWLYFSWLLAMALFFKFSRVLSMRNWDVATIFLLAPGLLMIQDARTASWPMERQPSVHVAAAIGAGATADFMGSLGATAELSQTAQSALESSHWLWWGYLWVLCGSAYFLFRCFLDLVLIKRPALAPNLSVGGLVWFGGALMLCLTAVAFRPTEAQHAGPAPSLSSTTQQASTDRVGQESPTILLVRQQFGARFWLERFFAVLGHIAVVAGLVFIGRKHFQDATAGVAAATFYLMLPYTGMYIGQAHHVWPMAFMIWAIAFYAKPFLAGIFLGLATGTMYFPIVVLPLWVGFYWKRGAGRFLLALFMAGSIGLAVLWLEGGLDASIHNALQHAAWQAWRVPTTESIWTGVHWVYRIPIFLAYVALVVIVTIWPWPKNLAQVVSLSAALLIGIQFWYADHGGVYVLWYLPLLLLLMFRPNLEERRPPIIVSERDWLARWRKRITHAFQSRVARRELLSTKS